MSDNFRSDEFDAVGELRAAAEAGDGLDGLSPLGVQSIAMAIESGEVERLVSGMETEWRGKR